jgi:heme A synthase
MDTTAAQLDALNARLIPLIAHDRAGFGGGVLNVGLLIVACTACATPSRHLWHALAAAGTVGFVAAIGVHPLVGYNNPVHLAPACMGAIAYFVALALTYSRARRNPAPSPACSLQ